MTRWIGLVLLLVTLATYTAPYALTDATVAMQSPFTPGNTFPVGNPGLVSYLEGHQIHDVWVNHWVGDVVMYLSNQQILCADYVGVVVSHAQKRFPEALDAVSAANHPSFIVHIRPGQAKTAAELALDNLGVTYKRARFGNLVVITPLSRTVRPQEIVSALMDGYSFN